MVALLLAGAVPERICCLTYTKAAAGEMRARVLSQLCDLLLCDETACREKVATLLGRAATEADIARARSLFGLVLDSATGGLQLITIHGFCQNILRRFPLEAGIAPHFTVLEESAADQLLAQAKHRLLAHYASGDPWLDAALSLIGSRSSESRFDGYMSHIVGKRGAWEEVWRNQTEESLRTRLRALHRLAGDITEDSLAADFCACVDAADAAVIRAHLPQLGMHSNKAEQEMARVFTAWLELDDAQRPALINEFCLLFLTKEGAPRARLLNAKEFPESAPLRVVCERLAERAFEYQQRTAALACAQESFAVAILARALLTLYEQAKTAAHALDYDDLIGKTRELFANPSMLGWVMTKLDHRIDHLLIDEAQDTSADQWAIARLLVEELIAVGEGSATLPRSLLVVGDEKQSIYSFQGAAPELFSGKKSEFAELLALSNAPLHNNALTHSYRSAEAILTFVDHVAAQPTITPALSAAGGVEPHQLVRAAAAGSVTLYPALIAPEREAAPALTMPQTYQEHKTAAHLLAEQVADTVAGWFAQGRMLASENRPLAPGDILILVHRRKPMVLPLIRALQRRGVPVAGLDRLTLSEHLAVRDLLALIRFVLNPADDLALAHALRSPILGMTDEELRALCVGRRTMLWTQLSPSPAREMLEQALLQRDGTPYDFLTHILETGDARRRFAACFGEEVHEVLDELKSQAAALPLGTAPTLANFYDWIHGSERQIKRELETGKSTQIRIMTVHGAKGLEAPVVLMVDTVSVPTTQHEMIYFTRDAHGQRFPALAISDEAKRAAALGHAKEDKAVALSNEYYRLLYVALTRARDELHIWGTASKKGEVKKGSWYEVVERSMRAIGVAGADEVWQLQDMRVVGSSINADEASSDPLLDFPREGQGLPRWAVMHAPQWTAEVMTASPSQLAPHIAVSPYAQAGAKSRRARGVLIHRILELLTVESDANTIARLVALIAPQWSVREQALATAEILALFTSEQWIWQHRAHAEVTVGGTLAIHGRDVAVSGQIDRLIETPTEIIILDYKTGSHIPKNAEEISENNRVQLKTYHALVRAIYPDRPVRCAILWTATARLMWCDDAVAATDWPNQFVMNNRPVAA